MLGFQLPNTIKSSPIAIELPRREREILEMMCLGSATKEIAYSLEIRVETVNSHIAAICRKARVSRTELVIWALQNPGCHVRGGKCVAGLHPPQCPCDSPYCSGMRRRAA